MESPRADDLEWPKNRELRESAIAGPVVMIHLEWPKNRELRESRSIQMHEAALQRVDGSLGAIARAHFVEQ